jgi:hypothetical protein
MQQQDKMILDQKKENESREKLGEKAPSLPEVTCGKECWQAKALWCCRLKKS